MAAKTKRQRPPITRVPLHEARADLGALIERIRGGDKYVVLVKDGEAVAALMDIDEFEDYLELQDPEMNTIVAESHQDYLAGRTRPAAAFFEELDEEERREREEASRA